MTVNETKRGAAKSEKKLDKLSVDDIRNVIWQ